MDAELKDKIVLVTGASGGIGRELVRQFSREGARVVIHYRNNVASARDAAIEAGEARSLVLQADLSKENEVQRLFESVEKEWGPVEVLVANAGADRGEKALLPDISLESWNRTVSSNLTATFLCTREFLRGVRKHGIAAPAIVLIGSTAGHYGELGHADYSAAKSALMGGFLKTVKNELARLAPKGRINAVCPGWTLTPMVRDFSRDPELQRRAVQTIAMKKVARPEDVAASVLFFASGKLSGHLTGETIFVSGGMEGRVLYEPAEIDVNEV